MIEKKIEKNKAIDILKLSNEIVLINYINDTNKLYSWKW